MMLLEKLNIDFKKPFILTLGSQANVGKSTAMAIMASELVNKGYSVCYVTEGETHVLNKKLKNLIYVKNGNVRILTSVNGEVGIQRVFDLGNFDFILCDSYLKDDKKFYDEICEVTRTQKISFIVTSQLKSDFVGLELLMSTPSAARNMSTYIVNLSRRKNSWFDKIKSFFGFTIKNCTFEMVKYRYGKNIKFDYFIDFKRINK